MAQALEGAGGLSTRSEAFERRQTERPAQEGPVDLVGRLDELGIPQCDGVLDLLTTAATSACGPRWPVVYRPMMDAACPEFAAARGRASNLWRSTHGER